MAFNIKALMGEFSVSAEDEQAFKCLVMATHTAIDGVLVEDGLKEQKKQKEAGSEQFERIALHGCNNEAFLRKAKGNILGNVKMLAGKDKTLFQDTDAFVIRFGAKKISNLCAALLPFVLEKSSTHRVDAGLKVAAPVCN